MSISRKETSSRQIDSRSRDHKRTVFKWKLLTCLRPWLFAPLFPCKVNNFLLYIVLNVYFAARYPAFTHSGISRDKRSSCGLKEYLHSDSWFVLSKIDIGTITQSGISRDIHSSFGLNGYVSSWSWTRLPEFPIGTITAGKIPISAKASLVGHPW